MDREYKYTIDALIEALTIFKKYCDCDGMFPTTCEHDCLFVNTVEPAKVTPEDKERLAYLGFTPYEDCAFISYRFGSN